MPQVKSISRGARGRAAADRLDQRKLFGERVAARDVEFGAVLGGELARGLFQFVRPHVVRWRIDEIAAQCHRLDDAGKILPIDALRHDKPHVARLALAVAGELIGPERKAERGKPRVVRRVGETVRAGRQQAHQLSRPEQVLDRFVGRLDAEQRGGELAVRRRHDEEPPGLGLVSGGADKILRVPVEVLGRGGKIAGVDKDDRHRLSGIRENRMHCHSTALRVSLGA